MPERTPVQAAEQAALWWVDHLRDLHEYVIGVATRSPGRRMAARESLWAGALRWGDVIGHPLAAALMSDHAAAAGFFADSAARRSRRDMDAALDMMLSNLEDQTRLYRADSTRFPAERWKDLFARHIAHTASYMEALLLAADMGAYEAEYVRAQKDRDELAAFSKEHFARGREPSPGR
jgi:hypothetical protein